MAARFHAPRDVRIDEVEPPNAGGGELVIKILVTNMCGTDLKTYNRGHPLIKPPMTMGHEYAGIVTEVGKGVRRFKEGDRVIASNSSPCFNCEMCNRRSYTLCRNIASSLIGFSVAGSYAEFVKIPSHIVKRNTYHLPRDPSVEELACAEPLASVIHALDKVIIREGMNVAIIGSGALGLLFLQLLKARGAKVIMTNRSAERLRVAERLGADQAIEVDGRNTVEKVRDATDGLGPDVVIEAVGKKETWEDSFRIVREGGTLLMFGGCAPGTIVSFDAKKIHYGEVTLVGSFHHEPSAFKRSLKSIQSGVVKVRPILSHTISLRRIHDAFELMEDRKALKVSIKP
jgi:L-iditol 2-dehydrogenase